MRLRSSYQPFALLAILTLSASGSTAPPATQEAIPIDETAEARLLQAAGQGFRLKRTTHFVIAYETTPEVVDRLLSRLEATYWSIYRFCEYESIPARRPDHRLEVIFFDTREAYERYTKSIRFNAEGTCGVYHEPSNRSAFFNIENAPEIQQLQANVIAARGNIDQLTAALKGIRDSRTIVEIEFGDGRRERMTRREADKQVAETRKSLEQTEKRRQTFVNRINLTVIQHETAHQVFYNAGVHVRGTVNPIWLVEGLACLFETPPGRTGAGFAAVNQLRLQDFRDAVTEQKTTRKLGGDVLLNAIAEKRIASPRDIILKPILLRQTGSEQATHYAVAWAMAMYAQRALGDNLAAYIRDVTDRKPGELLEPEDELALFEKHFGKIDDTFLKRFGSFILGLPLQNSGVR